jgi:F-type H+-transporting ATPase subunit b
MRGIATGAQIGRVVKMLGALSPMLLVAAAAYASGGGEGGGKEKWIEFGWKSVNFIILVGLLYWLLAGKLKEFFVDRGKNIRKALEEAIAAKEEAEKKFKEYELRLEKANEEIAKISEMIKAQGEAEKQKIIEDARKTAEKMKEDTQARMEQEFKKAGSQLRAEAALLSVQMAEELLKKNLSAKDHETMVRDYLDKVVKKP